MTDLRHWPRVYVCAPYADRLFVRSVVHPKLVAVNLRPVSTWANSDAEEDFADEQTLANAICENDTQLACSDAVLVIARPGAGGEMFAEVRIALVWGKPVFWVGRRILTAYRRGVMRFGGCDSGACRPSTGHYQCDDMYDYDYSYCYVERDQEVDKAIAAIKETVG